MEDSFQNAEEDSFHSTMEQFFHNVDHAGLMDDAHALHFREAQGVDFLLSNMTNTHIARRTLMVFLDSILRCPLPAIVRKNMIYNIVSLLEIESFTPEISSLRSCIRCLLECASHELFRYNHDRIHKIQVVLLDALNALAHNVRPAQAALFKKVYHFIETVDLDYKFRDELPSAMELFGYLA